ncbi:AfsR/SARP family transcriptional regulator [Saccharothrix isguenensis]
MEFRVLGPLDVRAAGVSVDVGGPRQRAVLAALLLRANEPATVEYLTAAVWETPPATPGSNLRTFVSGLRRQLSEAGDDPGRLSTRPGRYLLRVGPGESDLGAFTALTAAGDTADGSREAAEHYGRALELWRGRPLEGLHAGQALAVEVTRLEEQRLAVVEKHLRARLDLGEHSGLVAELRRLVADHPLHEELWGHLMTALHRSGRRADALSTYQEVHRLLDAELAVAPGRELRRLQARILDDGGGAPKPSTGQVRHSDDAEPDVHRRGEDEPDARDGSPRAHAPVAQLPAAPRTLVGRDDVLRALDTPSDDAGCPAVNVLTGMAGVGKTAVSLHWAHRNRYRFPDGQLYVNLRGHGARPPLTPQQALEEMLEALCVDPTCRPAEVDPAAAVYRSTLVGRRVLIMLDDAADADQVRPLLPGGRDCTVLITSRGRLDGLVAREGARQLRLESLGIDHGRAVLDSVAAGLVDAEPAATDELVALCGGLPLALRIAAAHLAGQPVLSVADYVAELRAGDRLAALEPLNDPRSAVAAAIDLSYAKLPPSTRRAFRLLGLLPGPDTTAPAVAALADTGLADAPRELRALVAANLVEQPAPGRYALHELLRVYAAAAATEDGPSPVDRLLTWYSAAADRASDALDPARQRLAGGVDRACLPEISFARPQDALDWFTAEARNLAAVVDVAAATGRHQLAWQTADAMKGYFHRGNIAQWSVVAKAGRRAAHADGHPTAKAAMANTEGVLAFMQGDYAAAADHLETTLAESTTCGWRLGQGIALANLGLLHLYTGTLDTALGHLRRGVEVADDPACATVMSPLRTNLGRTEFRLGRPAAAVRHHTQVASRDDRYHVAALLGLAEVHLHLGDLERVADLLDTAAEHSRRAPIDHEISWLKTIRGDLLGLLGRSDEAIDVHNEAVRVSNGHHFVVVDAQNHLAAAYLRRHRIDEAESWLGQALTGADSSRYHRGRGTALLGLAATRTHLGDLTGATTAATDALAIARRTGHRHIEAQSHLALADVHLRKGIPDRGTTHAERALAIHRETRHRQGQANALLLLGRVG